MSQDDKPLPILPSFVVSDSVTSDTDNLGTDAFVYCPDYNEEKYKEYKNAYKRKTDAQYGNLKDKYDICFERKHVKDAVHVITSEIKKKGSKTPLLILPFRPQQHDVELKTFLNRIFSHGKPIQNEEIEKIVSQTNEFILMSALKFIWCRLPGNAIIGWKVYTKFVKLEEEADFPKKAFLEFMPNCLSSGAHASIVYDFFDLIVALIMNSKENLLSAKKISKLCGLWAFHPVRNKSTGLPSFERGLYEWIPAGDAMFHLLLSFLNAMPPNGDTTKLPKCFQLLLKSSPYPPPTTAAILENSRYLQEIPMVTIRSNNPSKNPADLLSRVGKTLKFDDPTLFYTREDYLLLKRLFKDNKELTKALSPEGSRILENMCLYDEDLISDDGPNDGVKFKLVSGWSTDMTSRTVSKSKKHLPDFFTASVGRVSIDDYFIWTWMASLGSEETSVKKKTFGKTYIMEVELAEGFKKWVIVEEQDLERDGYDIEIEIKQEKLKELQEKIVLAEKEAEKIKKDAKHTRDQNLEDITNKLDQIDMAKNGQVIVDQNSLAPPPLPTKDYIPPRSKARKPPVPAGDLDVPARSPRRISPPEMARYTALHSTKISTLQDAKKTPPPPVAPRDYVSSDAEIRISLATFASDDSFMKIQNKDLIDADFELYANDKSPERQIRRQSPERLIQHISSSPQNIYARQNSPSPDRSNGNMFSPQRHNSPSPDRNNINMLRSPRRQNYDSIPSKFAGPVSKDSYNQTPSEDIEIPFRTVRNRPPPNESARSPYESEKNYHNVSTPLSQPRAECMDLHTGTPQLARPSDDSYIGQFSTPPLPPIISTVPPRSPKRKSNRKSIIMEFDQLESDLQNVMNGVDDNDTESQEINEHSVIPTRHPKRLDCNSGSELPNSNEGRKTIKQRKEPPKVITYENHEEKNFANSCDTDHNNYSDEGRTQSEQLNISATSTKERFQREGMPQPTSKHQRHEGLGPRPVYQQQPPPNRSYGHSFSQPHARSNQNLNISSPNNQYIGLNGNINANMRYNKQYIKQTPPQQYPHPYPSPENGYHPPAMQANGYYLPQPPPQHQVYHSSPQQGPHLSKYSSNVINHMPPSGKFNKLHGAQGFNKKNARTAFMNGDFGI